MTGPAFHQFPVRSVAGVARDADGDVPLTAADVGAAAAPLSTDHGGGTAATATANFTLPRAMAAGQEGFADVWYQGALQQPDAYTFNGTATAAFTFTMAIGDTWYVRLLAH